MKIKIKHFNWLEILLYIILFIFSMVIGSKYIGSDQKYYREVYNQLKNYNISNGYFYYSINLNSIEIVHYLIDWIFCRILPKDIIMSLFNALLGIITYRILRLWGSNRINALFIVFTNYYMLVLYFAAERLKFGFIIFGIGILLKNIKAKEYIYLMSILAHIQMGVLFLAIKTEKFVKSIKKFILNAKISLSILISIIFIISVSFIMSKQIITKITHYAFENIKFIDIAKIMVFFIFSYIYSKSKEKVVYMFLPLIFATFIIGSFRINIFAYFLMLYFCFPNKKGYNIAIFITNIYYLYTSINFITLIFKYGRAFIK